MLNDRGRTCDDRGRTCDDRGRMCDDRSTACDAARPDRAGSADYGACFHSAQGDEASPWLSV
jgi:hypothetical protein